jgi:hypothetical protein
LVIARRLRPSLRRAADEGRNRLICEDVTRAVREARSPLVLTERNQHLDALAAIELDGPQHLGDPVAYRRDRRKDQLLQENGYTVLRFPAEDVAKDLDTVLDAILRVLASRQQVITLNQPRTT